MNTFNKNGTRLYYTLLQREHEHSKWGIHFGSYDVIDVRDERNALHEAGAKCSDLFIVTTFEEQEHIEHAVKLLNRPV